MRGRAGAPGREPTLVLSCEHGGNRVPAGLSGAFGTLAARRALSSHRGWDAGALTLARQLARAFEAPLFACTTSRLVVDPNRSSGHPGLFSEWTRDLPREERERLVARWWTPHRTAVEDEIRARIRRGEAVLHLSLHSFTPVWKRRPRTVDLGLLYDPKRTRERTFAANWLSSLRARRPGLRLRRNQPYRGDADGFTTALRRVFRATEYMGLEVEVSQAFPLGPPRPWRELRCDIEESLGRTVSDTHHHSDG